MNLDNAFEGFSLWSMCSIAVMVVVIVALTRKVLTFLFPLLSVSKTEKGLIKTQVYSSRWAEFYNEIGLYLLPYLYASLIPLVPSRFLFGDLDTYGGKLFYCFLVTTFSALLVKIIKRKLPALFGVTVEDDDSILDKPPAA